MKIAEQKVVAEEPAEVFRVEPETTTDETFTRYVRAIADRSETVAGLVEELAVELRRTLVREMRWRSLWASSPAYVGVLGWPSWWSPGDIEGTTSPLDDFFAECYLFVFGKHLGQLLNQLRVRSKIDGLVVVFVRQFLTDRQKHHDPLGYRLFEILCTAVRRSVDTGDLHVLSGTPKIRNETVLGCDPAADPAKALSIADLRPLAARWNDDLLPDLVTAERLARREVTARLCDRLAELEPAGVTVFRFKDLLDALKEDVRARWVQLYRQEDAETVVEEDDEGVRRLVRILRPETRVEDLDSFKKLVRCVSNLIPRVEARKGTVPYLERLWNGLRRWSLSDRKAWPSYRKLEAALKIPRDRFAGLFEVLGQLTRRCQGELSGSVVEIESGRHRTATSAGAVSLGEDDG